MPEITYYADGAEHTLRVVFTRRPEGLPGWDVRRADNRRLLGWITSARPYHDGWQARAAEQAFRGESINDTGDLLDLVPADLTNEHKPGQYAPIGDGRLRADATEALLRHLRKNRAPALGFPRHTRVTTWESRRRHSRPLNA